MGKGSMRRPYRRGEVPLRESDRELTKSWKRSFPKQEGATNEQDEEVAVIQCDK